MPGGRTHDTDNVLYQWSLISCTKFCILRFIIIIIIIFCILTYRNIVSSYCNMSFCNISYLNICIFRGIFSGSTGNMSGASISNSCFTVLLPGHGLVLISFSTGQRDEHHAAFFIRQPQDQNWFIHTHRDTHSIYWVNIYCMWGEETNEKEEGCSAERRGGTNRYPSGSLSAAGCCQRRSCTARRTGARGAARASEGNNSTEQGLKPLWHWFQYFYQALTLQYI